MARIAPWLIAGLLFGWHGMAHAHSQSSSRMTLETRDGIPQAYCPSKSHWSTCCTGSISTRMPTHS